MPRTKKVGSAGRYGSRYGRRIRKRIISIEESKKKKPICPNCLKHGVTRSAAGIWVCKKCGFKFAGKAYKPA